MIYIVNQLPKHCPNCGTELNITGYNRSDFFAGASFRCNCGAQYQYAPTDHILEAADKTGDMKNYCEEE